MKYLYQKVEQGKPRTSRLLLTIIRAEQFAFCLLSGFQLFQFVVNIQDIEQVQADLILLFYSLASAVLYTLIRFAVLRKEIGMLRDGMKLLWVNFVVCIAISAYFCVLYGKHIMLACVSNRPEQAFYSHLAMLLFVECFQLSLQTFLLVKLTEFSVLEFGCDGKAEKEASLISLI